MAPTADYRGSPSPRTINRAPALVGSFLLLVSLAVMAGWVLQLRAIVQFLPGFVIVFNTAFCFGLSGLGLMVHALREPVARRAQTGLGVAIAAIGAVVLAQYVLGSSFGIDWPRLHAWLLDDNPFPGRMSIATSATFIAVGAALILMRRVRTPAQVFALRSLTGLIGAVGFLAVAGYLLDLSDVIENYWFTQPTAAGFVLIGLALWLAWRGEPWNRPLRARREDERIVLVGALTLAAAVVVAGFAGFRLLQAGVEEAFSRNLVLALKSREALLATVIEQDIGRAADLGRRPGIHRFFQTLEKNPADAQSRQFLQISADTSVKQGGLSGYEFLDPQGKPIARAGTFVTAPDLRMPLASRHDTVLMWDKGFVLHLETAVTDEIVVMGRIRTQQRVPELDRMIADATGLGQTGEIGFCRSEDASLHCAPTRFNPRPFDTPRSVHGKRLAMTYALEGLTGAVKTTDYRGRRVLAAYTPAGDLGIGMVLKMDLVELYAPVRRQLAYLIPVLALLLGTGVWLLRAGVRPLAVRLATSELRLRQAMEASRLTLWDWDIARGTVHLSVQWSLLLGEEPRPIDTTFEELSALVHPDDVAGLREQIKAMLKGDIPRYDVEHRVRTHSGAWKWIRSSGEVIERDRVGRALRAAGTNFDITARKEAEAELAHRAAHDGLTGLPNRILYFDRLEQAILRCRRSRALIAVMYLDIDRFKTINDTLGHARGDAVLQEVGSRLRRCVRATDTIARLGGDEFTLILEELNHRDNGVRIAEKIVAAIRAPFALEGGTIDTSTSVGIAFYDGAGSVSPDELVAAADRALYEAKRAGRDRFHVAG